MLLFDPFAALITERYYREDQIRLRGRGAYAHEDKE